MGTRVHRKSYTPLYYGMNNLNRNGNSDSWSHNYKDRNLTSSCYYGHFLQRQTTYGYAESEKEELKQAMLKHEVIFKNQVNELHRLYGVQKDFMNQLRRNNSQKLQKPEEASQSSPFSSQILSEDIQRMLTSHQNQLTRTRSSCSSSPTSPFYKMHSPNNFSEESSVRVSPVPIQKRWSLMNCELLQSTSKKRPIVKVDLQLSADEYIASEEMRHIKESYPLKRHCRVTSKCETSDESPRFHGDASYSESGTKCKRKLADFDVEHAATAPFNFMDPTLCHRESQGDPFCSKQNSVYVGLSMENLHDTWRGSDKGKNVDVQCIKNKDILKEPEAYANQSDSCPGSSSVSPPVKPKTIPCVNLSESVNNHPKLFGFEDQKWCSDINSRLISSFESARFQYNGIFPELQLDSSSSQNHARSTGIDFNCRDNIVIPGDGEYTAKHIGGSSSADVKSAKDMDLNLAPTSEGKNEDMSSEPPMPKKKSACDDGSTKGREALKMKLDRLHDSCQHSTRAVGTGVSDETSTQNLAPACAVDSNFQMLGFPMVNKICVSKDQSFPSTFSNSRLCSSEAVDTQRSAKVREFHTDFAFDFAKSKSCKKLRTSKLALGKALGELKSCRNRNSSNKETTTKTRRIRDRGLVIPMDADSPEVSFTKRDASNHIPEKGVCSLQTEKDTPQELVNVAAEVIFNMSTSGTNNDACTSLEASPGNSLHWFAEVATSIIDDHESQGCVDEDKLSEGVDYFELMTLKLTETEPDDYFSKSLMTEYPKEVADCSLLTTQRSRGKGRRGGQPKNFQRDVLPNFASLTKHEISEDLEMLEGLLKSMGRPWQIGLARRNAAKNGGTRGKGRLRSSDKILTARTI